MISQRKDRESASQELMCGCCCFCVVAPVAVEPYTIAATESYREVISTCFFFCFLEFVLSHIRSKWLEELLNRLSLCRCGSKSR